MEVLIIEDSTEIAANVGEYLDAKGHAVDFAQNGITGYQLAMQNTYDVIVLDLILPGMDGLTLCKKYQEEKTSSRAPILMLTAKDTIDDIVTGLATGADDYLVKPFSLQILLARLEVLARRANQQDQQNIIETHDLSMNLDTREVKRANTVISLKPTTAKILEFLIRNTHRVVPRREIEKEVWGDNPPNGDPIRAHIYNIRRSVDRDTDIKLVHTIHGIGYRVANIKHEVT